MSRVVSGSSGVNGCIGWVISQQSSLSLARPDRPQGSLEIIIPDGEYVLFPGQIFEIGEYVPNYKGRAMVEAICVTEDISRPEGRWAQEVQWIAETGIEFIVPEPEPTPQVVESMVHERPELLLVWQRRPIMPENVVYGTGGNRSPDMAGRGPVLLHVDLSSCRLITDGVGVCNLRYRGRDGLSWDSINHVASDQVSMIPDEIMGHPVPEQTQRAIAARVRRVAMPMRQQRREGLSEMAAYGFNLTPDMLRKVDPAPLPEAEERPQRRLLLQDEDED